MCRLGSRLGSHAVIGLALTLPMWILGSSLSAQQPADSLFPAEPPDAEPEEAPLVEAPRFTLEQAAEIEESMEALGSKEFAARERAATRLMEIGGPILPQLRRLAKDSADPEVRLRADQIVKQLTRGDMEARIASFLAGEDANLEGWEVARAIMGDSPGVRELFVELMKNHPDLTASLEGMPRDRAMAMDAAVTQVQNALFVERKFPSKADAFALLLPAVDPNVPLNAAYESVLLSVLQKNAVTEIRNDAQLSGPFRTLLGSWMTRSTLASRDDVLLFGMSWDIEATLPLAIQTLGEANQTETLAFALQAIARFGNRDHVAFVRPLLGDHRPSSERGFARGETVRTQLGDVAMAAIATLYKVPLSEAGFKGAESHPTYAFILTDIGFPVGDDAPRKAAREKIDKLLEEAPAADDRAQLPRES